MTKIPDEVRAAQFERAAKATSKWLVSEYIAPVNDGGAAFPQFEVEVGERDGHGDPIDAYTVAKGGMTLRDYFAAKAMSGVANGYWSNPNMSGLSPYNIADEAYQLADAMLAAREVRK